MALAWRCLHCSGAAPFVPSIARASHDCPGRSRSAFRLPNRRACAPWSRAPRRAIFSGQCVDDVEEGEAMALTKTVLVTGATDGVGRVVAQQLAAQGARVLLQGRSAEKGARVREEIARATGNAQLVYYNADLASLAAVRALAASVVLENERLDVLINNAGIGRGPPQEQTRAVSADGHELRFAV